MGIALIILGGVFLLVAVLCRMGKTDLLCTYHRNADYTREQFRRAISAAIIFLSVLLMGAGITSFFVNDIVAFFVLFAALALGAVPLWIVLKKYN